MCSTDEGALNSMEVCIGGNIKSILAVDSDHGASLTLKGVHVSCERMAVCALYVYPSYCFAI
jgi:hypothetical protein